MPETFSNDGSGLGFDYEVIELPQMTSANQVFALDPAYINDRTGLQYKESQKIALDGPNVVLIFKHLLREIVIEKFRNLQETLVKSLVQGLVPVTS